MVYDWYIFYYYLNGGIFNVFFQQDNFVFVQFFYNSGLMMLDGNEFEFVVYYYFEVLFNVLGEMVGFIVYIIDVQVEIDG